MPFVTNGIFYCTAHTNQFTSNLTFILNQTPTFFNMEKTTMKYFIALLLGTFLHTKTWTMWQNVSLTLSFSLPPSSPTTGEED